MKYACDLHIHTALSPCANEEMTPNNIVNMSLIKGLDIIAITDHNSAKNVRAVIECAKGKNLIVLPGIEVNTREDIHVLCYFSTIEKLEEFDAWLYVKLAEMPFEEKHFGSQLVMDSSDEVISHENKFLLQGADVSFNHLLAFVNEMGGIAVPAHINRTANSLLYIFGFIPVDPLIKAVELGRLAPTPKIDINKYHVINSSDAHDLSAILEREYFIDLNAKSAEELLQHFNNIL